MLPKRLFHCFRASFYIPLCRHNRAMLQKLPKPQAIVCENNLLALGVVNALRDLSFSIPDDIGLLTFDIYPYSKIITPQPTVIDINMYDIGIQAERMMLHTLENPRLKVQSSPDPDSGADYHQNHINGSASYNTEQGILLPQMKPCTYCYCDELVLTGSCIHLLKVLY